MYTRGSRKKLVLNKLRLKAVISGLKFVFIPATQIRQNIKTISQSIEIPFRLQGSVRRMVRKERVVSNCDALYGVPSERSYGAWQELCVRKFIR